MAKTMVSWQAFPSLPPRSPRPSRLSRALNSLSFPLQTPATQAIIRCVSKIVHEWKGHLEIFNPPQAIENFRQFLLLRTDILQNTAVGDEDFIVKRSN